MDLSEFSRLMALAVLGLPAILLWRQLRKTNRSSARRYMLGILGLVLWAFAGVLLMALVLYAGGEKPSAFAAIVFLLAWIGVGVTGFLAFGVPPEFAHGIRPSRLKAAGAGFAFVTIVSAVAAIALG